MTPDEIKKILAADELTDEIHDWFYSEWPNAGWPKFITIDEMNIIQAIVWKTYQKCLRDTQREPVKVVIVNEPLEWSKGRFVQPKERCGDCREYLGQPGNLNPYLFCPKCGVPIDRSEGGRKDSVSRTYRTRLE